MISKTQDTKKHSLVFRENKNYGFQRNLRGLKWIGMLIAFATLAASVLHFILHTAPSEEMTSILRTMSIVHILPMTISAVMLLCWIFLVTEQSVRRAGFAYADRLIRTCDYLAGKRK